MHKVKSDVKTWNVWYRLKSTSYLFWHCYATNFIFKTTSKI